MALQVWLPLTKDLRQQGIANTTAISLVSGNALADSGKLGNQCLVLTKLQTILGNYSCMSNKKQISYAYWVKVNTAWSSNWLDGIRWTSSNGSTTSVTRQEFYTNCTKIGTWFPSSSTNSISGKNFTPGVWTHLAATFDYNTGDVSFYINGVLQGHVITLDTTYYCRGDFYIGDNGVDISMNDVRIYDHCLSPMEVKQISQGLVLHYPLNRQGWGQENLLKNSYGTIIDKTGNAINSRTEYSAWNVGSSYIDITTTTPVTISFDLQMYVSDLTTYGGQLLIYNTNNKGPVQINGVGYVFKNKYTIGNTINERVSLTTKLIPRTDATQTNNFIEFYTGYGSNNFYKISNVKLELGEIATPWCPNSSDALATTMGLNSITEYDCSGFCNNGTRTGTFTWTSDTPKYAVSQQFNGSAYTVLPITCSVSSDAISVAVWGYESNWNTSTAERLVGAATSSSGWCIGDYGSENTLFAFYANGSYNTATGFKSLSSGWHHFVITFDGLNLIYYVDGQEYNKKTFSSKQSVTGNYNINMGRHYGGGYSFKGRMSDFRIYATALSASDVKSLYQNCATIDPDGTIRGKIR